MALSMSSCCLNHFHPIPSSTSKYLPPKPTQVPWSEKEIKSLKRHCCVLGVACTIILGLEIGMNSSVPVGGAAVAADDQEIAFGNWGNIQIGESKSSKVRRWSDKLRGCPPWRLNLLETIVPENLPRPSARRRWEAIGNNSTTSHDEAAANVSKIMINPAAKKCFSL